MNLGPLSFPIRFSSLPVLKTEFPGLEFHATVLSSALSSTSPPPQRGPWLQIKTAFKWPGPSSKAPTLPRDFPSFPDFPKPQSL